MLDNLVALHPEGVDRNTPGMREVVTLKEVALHPEGVDRNISRQAKGGYYYTSPSTRRAWIEMRSAYPEADEV